MNVKLHGMLAQRFGDNFFLNVDSISEAIRAIQANTGTFYDFLKKKDAEGICYKVVIGKDALKDGISAEELSLKRGLFGKTINIIPVPQGSENLQAILNIIIGLVLVVAGFMTGNPFLVIAGAMMIIGGIMQLVTKPPKPPAPGRTPSRVTTQSFEFSGPTSTMKQGVPVKLGYGQLKIGSNILSTAYRSTSYFSEYDASTSSGGENFLPGAGDSTHATPVNWSEKPPRYGNVAGIIDSAQKGNTADEHSAPETPPGGPLMFPTWNAYLTGLSTMFDLREIGGALYFVDKDGNKVDENLRVASDTPTEKEKAIENWLNSRGFISSGNSIPAYESGSPITLGGDKVSRSGPSSSALMATSIRVSYDQTDADSDRETSTYNSVSFRWSPPSATTVKVSKYHLKIYPIIQYQYILAFNEETASPGAKELDLPEAAISYEFDFVQNNLDHKPGEQVNQEVLTAKEFYDIANREEEIGLAYNDSENYSWMIRDKLDHSSITNSIDAMQCNVNYFSKESTSTSLTLDNTDPITQWMNLNPSKVQDPYSEVKIILVGDNSGQHGARERYVSKQTEKDDTIAPDSGKTNGVLCDNVLLINVTSAEAFDNSGTTTSSHYRPSEYDTQTDFDPSSPTLNYSAYDLLDDDDNAASSELELQESTWDDGSRNFKIYMDARFMVAFSIEVEFEDGTKSSASNTVMENSEIMPVRSSAESDYSTITLSS